MKVNTVNHEMAKGPAELVLWRRFGHGFWFQVRSTSLARDKRSLNLIRTMHAEQYALHQALSNIVSDD